MPKNNCESQMYIEELLCEELLGICPRVITAIVVLKQALPQLSDAH
uniref:Uncharacterized protein n=1 Tax=Anguilla anguilla TaxID=7936 RepID=A0A0E9SDC9_ANGAN